MHIYQDPVLQGVMLEGKDAPTFRSPQLVVLDGRYQELALRLAMRAVDKLAGCIASACCTMHLVHPQSDVVLQVDVSAS